MMKRLMIFLLVLGLMLSASLALADEVFTAGGENGACYESDQAYLRIVCPVADDSRVTVTITDENGSIIYQRDYGLCSGDFRSEDIYLRLNGVQTLYCVRVAAGDDIADFQVNRTMPRLQENAACSVGYPLSQLSGAGSWKSATLLDLSALADADLTVPMHASGAYTLGSVTFHVSGGALTVHADITDTADGSIDRATVYVATNPIDAQNLGTKSFSGLSGKLDEPIDLLGAEYAAVYVKLTVSFNPADLPASPAVQLDGQEELWQQMLLLQPDNAVG